MKNVVEDRTLRYQVKRKRLPRKRLFGKDKPARWELFGESHSLEIAGRLMAMCPFTWGEEVVIVDMEDERYPEVVAVKGRKDLP